MAGPFDDLQIDDSSFLDLIDERITCDKCNRSRKYYCYSCFKPVGGIGDKLPKVQLPIKVDIIKHPNEIDGKSTAAHAAILAPDHVTVYTFPCIPEYRDKNRILLIFPGKDAVTLNELKKHSSESTKVDKSVTDRRSKETLPDWPPKINTDAENVTSSSVSELKTCSQSDLEEHGPPPTKKLKTERSPFDRVVFIDSTWAQTTKISKDERLKGLTSVELQSQVTRFWRHQKDKPDTYLATIEAIYYFFTEFHSEFIQTEYTGQYDNLLFFFKYLHHKLWKLYNGEKPKRKNQQKKEHKDKNTNH